ncbi:DUF4185 domain-containing protein [Nocardioides sp. Root140]|uniref:DUF4185 domain-containing protein n=1 Tax=Nocardioides sp. Root140 TaxID=1736460 RepID=UPI0006F8F031|nr:DUF4185 domain-containing protein [Nocardioides sp. Root140]KQY56572.1 hypothetical protein ASD30_09600 [Nocardioides sp. Root140]
MAFDRTGLRLHLLVLVVCASVVLLALWGGAAIRKGLRPEPEAQPSDDASVSCVPTHPPRTVADINTFVGDTRRIPGFVGADVGASVALSDGRSLWVFGDTLHGPKFNGPSFVRNSMLLIGDECASVVLPADRGAIVPNREDGVGYWPMSVDKRALDGHDLVGVGLLRVQATGNGLWDFRILGSSIAEFDVPANGTPELMDVRDVGPDRVDDTRPTWGAAVAVRGETLYVYGTAHPDDDRVLGWSLHVARVPLTSLTDTSAWRFWTGTRWSRSDKKLATLIPAKDGVSRVLSVFEQDGAWYAVSKRNDVLGTDLVIWRSRTPTGPFVAGPAVATIPSGEDVLQYMPLAHPHLLPKRGTVVVSWSRNIADLDRIAEDPSLYRPEFARVPLP